MNVVVVLTGQLRNFKACYPAIKRCLIEPLQADVLISTWDVSQCTPSTNDGVIIADDGSLDDAITLYHPIAVDVEPYDSDVQARFVAEGNNYPNRPPTTKAENVLAMHYRLGQARATLLTIERALGRPYQVIVRTRPDVQLDQPLTLPTLMAALTGHPQGICVPTGGDWLGGINDVFAAGWRGPMLHYLDAYRAMPALYAAGSIFHPETILRRHLEAGGVEIIRLRFAWGLRDFWPQPPLGDPLP